MLSATFVSRDLGDIALQPTQIYNSTPTVRASSVEICLNYTYIRQSTIFQILSPTGIPLKGGLPCAHASTAALAEEKVLYLKNLKYLLGVVTI